MLATMTPELERLIGPVLAKTVAWQLSVVDQALEQMGIDRSQLPQGSIHIGPGEHAFLTTGDQFSLIQPLILQLDSIDQVKALIGFPDQLFEEVLLEEPEVPGEPWVIGTAFDREGLCCEELTRLQKAAYAYVYGHSQRIDEAYRQAIQHYYYPYELAIYAAGGVTIDPGGRLEVRGKPAFLLFDRLDIHRGGNLTITVPFNITVNLLQAAETPGSLEERIHWEGLRPPA